MATFYGQLTTPQQPSFTFDKVYTSRSQLLAEGGTDEVMIGRYVLVTYGAASTMLGYYDEKSHLFYHSYTQAAIPSDEPIFTNPISGATSTVYENLLAKDYLTRYYYYASGEFHSCQSYSGAGVNPEDPLYTYIPNLMQDVNAYLQPCHNSVFIKLYSTIDGYYYREIASLNEYLPVIDFIIESPNTTAAQRRTPYIYKTGLTYSVHMSQTPVYLLGPINDYNVAGFDPAVETKKIPAAGSKLERGFFYQPAGYKKYPYNALDNVAGNVEDPDKEANAVIDKYYLQTVMTDIGNTIADMWNLIYGPGKDTTLRTDSNFETTSGVRDTTFNTDYGIAHGLNGQQPGGKDYDSIRGIANTMIELIGYEGYEQKRNPYDVTQLEYSNGTDTKYWGAGEEPELGYKPVYDRNTLRGLLAEGADFNQKMNDLDATLAEAHADLDEMAELLGEDTDEGNTTMYGVFNNLQTKLGTATQLIGQNTDLATDQIANEQDVTLWGMYNLLKDLDITKLVDLIGASERGENDNSILQRVASLEDDVVTLLLAFDQMTSQWTYDEETGTLSTQYKVTIEDTLTALNVNNKVRGAMWAN